MTSIEGGCLCGAVRYHVTAQPITTRVCWCRLCQKIGAGSATVNVFFPTETMVVTGETVNYESIADSGNLIHRRFCPKCGTHVFTQADARPHVIGVRAGSLDDPEVAKPEMTIWTSLAPSWACIDESLPTFPTQPPPPPKP